MKRLKISLAILPALVLLAGCGNSETGRVKELMDKQSSGVIRAEQSSVDLGTIRMSEGKVDIPYTFRNDGDEPVVLLEGTTSCMCTEAVVKSNDGAVSPRIKMPGHGPTARIYQVMDPGEEAEPLATYDPNAHGPKGTGPIMRDVILRTTSTMTPKVIFRFSGNVVP